MKVLKSVIQAVSVGNPRHGYGDKEGKNDSERMLRSMPESKKPENYRKFGHLFKVIDGQACWMKSRSPEVVFLFARYKKSAAVIVVDEKTNEAVGVVTMDYRGILDRDFSDKVPMYTPTSWIDTKFRGRGLVTEIYEIVLTKNGFLQDFSQTEDSHALWKKLVSKGYPVFFLNEHGDIVSSDANSELWRDPNTDLALMPKGTTLRE